MQKRTAYLHNEKDVFADEPITIRTNGTLCSENVNNVCPHLDYWNSECELFKTRKKHRNRKLKTNEDLNLFRCPQCLRVFGE